MNDVNRLVAAAACGALAVVCVAATGEGAKQACSEVSKTLETPPPRYPQRLGHCRMDDDPAKAITRTIPPRPTGKGSRT